MHAPLHNSLELILGEASPIEARVYARVARDSDNSMRLTGSIVGPECAYAHTLTSPVSFRARRGEQEIVAEALVPDPCFWTPEMPYLYRVNIDLEQGGRREHSDRLFGIRPLGAKGRDLIFASRRWVLRAVSQASAANQDLGVWRESEAAIRVAEPTAELCAAASKVGVLVVADLSGSSADYKEALARLSRWPAVGIAILPADVEIDPVLRRAAGTMLLGYEVQSARLAANHEAADLLFVKVDDMAPLAELARVWQKPLVAVRPVGQQPDLATARRSCELLQRDLTAVGDFAGYMV